MNKERTMTKSSSGDARAHARRARRRGAGLGSEEEEERAGEIRAWCGWGLRGRGGGAQEEIPASVFLFLLFNDSRNRREERTRFTGDESHRNDRYHS